MKVTGSDHTEGAPNTLLALLQPLGLDWHTTREEFRKLHGLSKSETGGEIVRFPPASLITQTPLTFAINWNKFLASCPPDYIFAHFPAQAALEETHRRALAELQEKLGPGADCENDNTLIQKWRFGLLEAALYTWLPSRHSPPLTGFDPKTAIIISSELAFIHADTSLDFLIELHQRANPDEILLFPAGSFFCSNTLYTRVHSEHLKQHLPKDGCFAWKFGNRIGFSTADRSVVVERSASTGLILTDIKPSRGPGGASISIRTRETSVSEEVPYCRVAVRSGEDPGLVRAEYEKLLGFYGCISLFEEDTDD